MIRYNLTCASGCEFEAWFGSSESFDAQAASHQIECPNCGSLEVDKSIMSPQVTRARRHGSRPNRDAVPGNTAATDAEIMAVLRRFRAEVEARSEYVGRKFAAEVRDMHFDDKPKRDVWGEATPEEVHELLEDDIAVMPLPKLPKDAS